ncbi:hypothetical protein HK414_15220 [Ramlibacter terrae]|uniref:PAC domain-containing protein n=1 Tax=Ramlibacter terrae TaxID=2732511 RepID=A0ABX6P354_9BURK|nr:hypothetical protein HK414_15220 [Ramlibacter terrae]
MAVIFSDITQRLLAEQDLRRLAEELAQINKRKTEFWRRWRTSCAIRSRP